MAPSAESLPIDNGGNMCKKHVLIIPVCLQAHFFAIYRHAVELAKRGITITFVGLGREIAVLRTFEELEGLDFNLLSYEDFGTPDFALLGHPLLDVLQFMPTSKNRFQPIFEKLLADKKAGIPGPTCIIGDRFLAWASDMASVLKVPYYQFYSCGVVYPRALQANAELHADGALTLTKSPMGGPVLTEFEGLLEIAGLPPLKYHEMLNSCPFDTEGVAASVDRHIGKVINEAYGLIVNSFYELEVPQIEALQQRWKEVCRGQIPKLFLIGPVSKPTTYKDRSFAGKNQGIDCLQWLDEKPPQSVVYLCIGSIAQFSLEQMKEVALALEASKQNFLWVIPKGGEADLPPNFTERTKEKGLMVSGWVPQLRILQHSSIGGFVTHCGWNSLMESITSGVPMAAWPQLPNDQFINCRHFVDVLKVAVEVRSEDLNSLEKAVRLLLSEEGNSLRTRVQDLKKKSESVVAEGGASKKAMNDILESIPC